jgi:hypothetical protein
MMSTFFDAACHQTLWNFRFARPSTMIEAMGVVLAFLDFSGFAEKLQDLFDAARHRTREIYFFIISRMHPVRIIALTLLGQLLTVVALGVFLGWDQSLRIATFAEPELPLAADIVFIMIASQWVALLLYTLTFFAYDNRDEYLTYKEEKLAPQNRLRPDAARFARKKIDVSYDSNNAPNYRNDDGGFGSPRRLSDSLLLNGSETLRFALLLSSTFPICVAAIGFIFSYVVLYLINSSPSRSVGTIGLIIALAALAMNVACE